MLEIRPAIGPCFNFTGADGKIQKPTVVIAPTVVKVITAGNGDLRHVIKWDCSHSFACHNENCDHSKINRQV